MAVGLAGWQVQGALPGVWRMAVEAAFGGSEGGRAVAFGLSLYIAIPHANKKRKAPLD